MSVIQDECGHTVIDAAYVRAGIEGKWLILSKWYEDENGEMVWVYTMK